MHLSIRADESTVICVQITSVIRALWKMFNPDGLREVNVGRSYASRFSRSQGLPYAQHSHSRICCDLLYT